MKKEEKNKDIWANLYRNKKGRSLKKSLYILRFLEKKHKRILELFVSSGYNIEILKSKNKKAECYGIDNDKELCIQAKKKGYKTITTNCNNIPLEDNTFDLIYCNSFHHATKSFNKIFNKSIRLLKKDGLLIGIEPYGIIPRILHSLISKTPDFIINMFLEDRKTYLKALKHECKVDNVLDWYKIKFKKKINKYYLIHYKRDLLGIWYCIKKE